MNIKFSIIVPIFNVEPFLNKCINSILSQTYANMELILVDDGSNDNSSVICDYYEAQDKRVKVIHKINGGLVSARQAGVRAATGDYVCCVDGDDYIAPNYLQKMFHAIERYNADIVCCRMNRFTPDRIIEPRRRTTEYFDKRSIEENIYPILIEGEDAKYFPPSIWAKAFRKNIYEVEQLEVSQEISIGEDRATVIPCIIRCDCLVFLEEALYYYRINTQSMTHGNKGFSWMGLEKFAEHIKQRVDLGQFDFQEQYDRLITHQFFLTANSQFKGDKPYKDVRLEILEKMSIPIFLNSIKRSHFSSFRAINMSICLKNRLIWPILLYRKMFLRFK